MNGNSGVFFFPVIGNSRHCLEIFHLKAGPETLFLNTVFRLTGWFHQPAPPQQLGQDFRPSHTEDGGSCESGGIAFARIRRKTSRQTRAVGLFLPPTQAESCIEEGKGRQPAVDGRRRTTA